MASPTSSTASPSPSASPQSSKHLPPSLDLLVIHFVAAKRSLTTTSTHVWRADELVTHSRALAEEIAVLNARNDFACRGVDDQIQTLHAIRDDISRVGTHAQEQLNAQLATLDAATKRLEETLQTVRDTIVDPSLQSEAPTTPGDILEDDLEEPTSQSSSSPAQRTLFDYIDPNKHEQILDGLRKLVETFFQNVHASLADSLETFDGLLDSISQTLSPNSDEKDARDPGLTQNITQLYRGMEQHAGEMATLLQSLVSHYDLCVSALKHTEGGGEAAKEAVQAEKLAQSGPGAEESLYRKTAAEPISTEELAEMLGVVARDAQEVDDVVVEIGERIGEMETYYEQLMSHCDSSRKTHQRLRHALECMDEMRVSLPSFMAAGRTFRESWQEIQADLHVQTAALDEMTDFYQTFIQGYAKLLKEIERRRSHAEKAQALAARANRELERLWEADDDARQRFFAEVGPHLPQDLYPALCVRPTRWEMCMKTPE